MSQVVAVLISVARVRVLVMCSTTCRCWRDTILRLCLSWLLSVVLRLTANQMATSRIIASRQMWHFHWVFHLMGCGNWTFWLIQWILLGLNKSIFLDEPYICGPWGASSPKILWAMCSRRLLRICSHLCNVRVYVSCWCGVASLHVMWLAISFIDAAVCCSVSDTDGRVFVRLARSTRAFIGLLIRRTTSVAITPGATCVLLRISTGSSGGHVWKLRSCRFNIVDVLFKSVGDFCGVLLPLAIWTNLISPSAGLANLTSWLVASRLIVEAGLWRSFWRSGCLGVFRGWGLMDRWLLLLLTSSRLIPSSSVSVRLIGGTLPWGATILIVNDIIISSRSGNSVPLGTPC